MRNTPTGVGKTAQASGSAARAEKHPHGRGEDAQLYSVEEDVMETPPRAWGRLAAIMGLVKSGRNTPTGVGKTLLSALSVLDPEKHPHGRGEDRQRR